MYSNHCSIGYFVLLILEFSFSNGQGNNKSNMNWKKPKISMISHSLIKDSIDIKANTNIHIKCTGDKPLTWNFPHKDLLSFDSATDFANITNVCNQNNVPICMSDVFIENIKHSMTGYFICHYKDSDKLDENNSNSIYLFINDNNQLLVPINDERDFISLTFNETMPAKIPCKPTHSESDVRIWNLDERDFIGVNGTVGVSYDPKSGFYFEAPIWEIGHHFISCRIKNADNDVTYTFMIFISKVDKELKPHINDSKAKNIFTNSTFSLNCSVIYHLDAIVRIHWEYPKINISRINETSFWNHTKDENRTTCKQAINILTINQTEISDQGIYKCIVTDNLLRMFTKSIQVIINDIISPEFTDKNMSGPVIAKSNTHIKLECFVNGNPKPLIKWYKNNDLIKIMGNSRMRFENYNQSLIFTQLITNDTGYYECEAENIGDRVRKGFNFTVIENEFVEPVVQLSQSKSGLSPEELIIIILFVVVGTVMILMAVLIGKKIRKERKDQREMNFISYHLFKTGQTELFNPDMPLDEQIDLLPYDPRYEVPEENLKLGKTLGQGAFGRVVKALATGLDEEKTTTIVAVKMLKERSDVSQRKALMAELKILIHLGRHLNIVNLLGAVTKNLVKGELLLIVEYCRFGNLRQHLLTFKHSFVNQLNQKTGLIDLNIVTKQSTQIRQNTKIASNSSHPRNYVNSIYSMSNNRPSLLVTNTSADGNDEIIYTNISHENQSVSYSNDYSNEPQNSGSNSGSVWNRGETITRRSKEIIITTSDLLCYAFQSACGMQYLAQRKLIHRDLAARNVLLADDNIVKICDFGLAKDVYKYDNYVKKNDGPLPIKWMAIESIRDKVFTTKSDVWSFGVLLWEFFTLGGNPYPGVEIDAEFFKKLESGYRMEKPNFCPNRLYDLINHCWEADPDDRPTFLELTEIIGEYLQSNTREHFLSLNNPHKELNDKLLNTDEYLKMTSMSTSSLNINKDYLKMKSQSISKDDLIIYNQPGPVRPINESIPVTKEPMEIVPMIQF